MIAPAVLSHYHHKARMGHVHATHVVHHPLNAERVSLTRSLLLAFIMGVVWMPFYCWEEVRKAVKRNNDRAFSYGFTMLLAVFGVSFFVALCSDRMTLGGIVRRQGKRDQSGEKPRKDEKEQ